MENPNRNSQNSQIRGPSILQTGQIPSNILPPQMIQRGPPPSLPPLPSYSHQPVLVKYNLV